MIETNPYRLEEAEWTPGNVYDIIPPGDLSHTGFEYSEGSDNIDEEEVRNSLVSGVADFFGELLGGVGKILGGAIGAGVGILGGIVQGVTGLIGEIASAIGGLIPDGARATPIRDAVVAQIGPIRTQVGTLGQNLQELSDEVDGRIDEQKDLIDDANVAIGEAKDLTAAVKKVADQNKKDVASAITKADAANASLAELAPKVTDAVSKANKASSDVSTLTPKVTSASEEAAKASQDVAALSPKVADAVSKSEKATSDVAALTPQVAAAQSKANSAYAEAGKVRSEVTPKIEAAQTKGENALAVADKAVDWLKNPVEIGTSLIAIDPETKRPHYANRMELVDDNPPGTSGPTYMSPASASTLATAGPHVPVDSKIKYTVSFWAKASVAGSVIYGQMRSQEESYLTPDGKGLFSGGVSVSNPPQPSNKGEDGEYVHSKTTNSYFAQNLELQTEWTYYETEIQFAEGVTSARVSGMYWSHTNGVKADQYISGLDIRPQIPTQASVDKAQNDAIKANADILRQQQEINAAQATANLAQKNFNDNQTKWNLASTNATKALTDAAKAQEDINAEQAKFNSFQTQFNKDQTKWNQAVDRSIATQKTVNDNFEKWTNGAATAIQANTDATKALARITGLNIGGRNLLRESLFQKSTSEYLIHRFPLGDSKPEDGEEVTFSIKAKPGEGKTRFRLYNSNGNGSSALFDIFIDEQEPSPDGVYRATGKWKVAGGNTHLNVYAHPSSVKTPNEIEWVKLERGNKSTDWSPAPEDIPTQAQVDEAQNKAIEANTETIKHQIEINNLFQERMWSQLDMIEQLDIQQTRVVHMKANEGDFVQPPSWVSSGRVSRVDSPFLTAWNFGGNARWAAWQAKGKWEGKLKHTLNFTNGAVDVYVHDITKDGVRSMKVEGGAIFVANYRNSTFEIFPSHLGRTVGIRNPDSSGWYVDQSVMETGGPSMVRHQTADEIRFTSSFYCNLAFYARDIKGAKTLVKANQVVEPMTIRRADLRTGITYTFSEAPFTTNTW